MTDLTAPVDAAAREVWTSKAESGLVAYDNLPAGVKLMLRNSVLPIVTAAAGVIEQQIKDELRGDIEAVANTISYEENWGDAETASARLRRWLG